MQQWDAALRKSLAEYLAVDPDSRFSDRLIALKLLTRSGLNHQERADVMIMSGNVLDPDLILRVLQIKFPKKHIGEHSSR